MNNLIDLATNPEQYSKGSASTWLVDDVRQREQQERFWKAISPFIKSPCRTALDIGCGSGWSSVKFSELGADWVGLEPSSAHFDMAKNSFPKSNILNVTLEKYSTSNHFDCIIAIMVFSHILNVEASLKKIHELLNDGGVFIMICSTFHDEDVRLERNGRKYEVEVIDEDQYADKAIVGAYGIADINRKPEYYIDRAISSGLSMIKHLKVEDIGYSPKELLVFVK